MTFQWPYSMTIKEIFTTEHAERTHWVLKEHSNVIIFWNIFIIIVKILRNLVNIWEIQLSVSWIRNINVQYLEENIFNIDSHSDGLVLNSSFFNSKKNREILKNNNQQKEDSRWVCSRQDLFKNLINFHYVKKSNIYLSNNFLNKSEESTSLTIIRIKKSSLAKFYPSLLF